MTGPRRLWLVLAAVTLAGCGASPTGPFGEDPDDTAAGGPVHGCRPPLSEHDPDPLAAGGGQDHALGAPWVGEIAGEVQTEHTDVLGGVWLDNAAGELVIMVPGTEGRDVFDRLRADAPEPGRVVCMEATYTEAELSDLQEQVFARIGDARLSAGGGIDVIRNHVTVDIETDAEEARAALGDLADHPALELRVPECADVVPPPEGAQPLPGDGSNCHSMQALFSGTLVGDAAAGCAWFEDDQGQPITVVWPRGWSLTDDGTVLDHRGEPRASLGDTIESGGGNVPLQEGQRACGIGGEDGAWAVGTLDTVGAP